MKIATTMAILGSVQALNQKMVEQNLMGAGMQRQYITGEKKPETEERESHSLDKSD